MRTIAYIDGFNLYYRMLRDRPQSKWLNQRRLIENLLSPAHKIATVNYYIARVSARAHDPHAPARQATYLKALSSVAGLRVHEGTFMTTEPWMPLASPPQCKPATYVWSQPVPSTVRVIKSEEKGSDVNLASHLVRDAFLDKFDVAVVLTNDSDLVEPIKIATLEAGKRVGLLVPVKYPNASLMSVASFYLRIRPGHLNKSQFPESVSLADGTLVQRPASWA
jgi:uncharacterized LabA/DUF88 family protein